MKNNIFKNLNSFCLIVLGIINLILYLTPFIVFEGLIPSFYNGYELFSWFNSPYDEGPIITIISLVIFMLSMIMLIIGLISLQDKSNLKKVLPKGVFYVLILLFFISNAIGLPALIHFADVMSTKYIFSNQIPSIGIGAIILFAINMISCVSMFVFSFFNKSNAQRKI